MKPVYLMLAFGLFCTANANAEKVVADSGIAARPIEQCNTDLRYLNQVVGWQVIWPRQWRATVSAGTENIGASLNKLEHSTSAIEQAIRNLHAGIKAKETAPRAVVIRVQQQLKQLIAALKTKDKKYFFDDANQPNAQQWNQLLSHQVLDSIVSFHQFINDKYLPNTRMKIGLSDLNGGKECFSDAITWWTTLSPTENEIERIGHQFLAQSQRQLLATGRKGQSLQSILEQLRNSASTQSVSEDQLVLLSQQALEKAKKHVESWFLVPINQKVDVTKMPKYMQQSAPAGYYARSNNEIPARYIINPSRANERRLMAEVIAFHEGIPGHHLWSTYPKSTSTKAYNSGILEGWALYSEYLADEMGLYSTTYDRQGMITKHLWAASRLIVEPGIHLRGWSRDKAINFMLDNTVMSQTEIEIEVDRYIAMPGQSLSYILGADVILSQREWAQDTLGDTFDIKAFHDVILSQGVRSLPKLKADIRDWANATLAIRTPIN